jgi:hypothetical protein
MEPPDTRTMQTLTDELSRARQELIAEQIRSAAIASGMVRSAIDDCIRAATSPYSDEDTRFDVGYESAEEWVRRQRQTSPHWWNAPAGDGSSETQEPLYRAAMTTKQKSDYITQHGADDFFKLPLHPPADHPQPTHQGQRRRRDMSAREKSAIIAREGIDGLMALPW